VEWLFVVELETSQAEYATDRFEVDVAAQDNYNDHWNESQSLDFP
jgi:hypothetical protein